MQYGCLVGGNSQVQSISRREGGSNSREVVESVRLRRRLRRIIKASNPGMEPVRIDGLVAGLDRFEVAQAVGLRDVVGEGLIVAFNDTASASAKGCIGRSVRHLRWDFGQQGMDAPDVAAAAEFAPEHAPVPANDRSGIFVCDMRDLTDSALVFRPGDTELRGPERPHGPYEQTRLRVRNAIDRTLARADEREHELAEHLGRYVGFDRGRWSYRPEGYDRVVARRIKRVTTT